MKKVLALCAVLLAGCALSETEQKVEAKQRFDKVYPVELAHYEYEERLQTFYDAEEILPEHLGRLYKGEFPNGETLPNRLRIHWTNARALAQAEVELQKDILGWAGADVSPRPILVNDPNEKFYRYYEYRVLMGGKEVGAVRIPAYRRTENFATAEVHQYNGDASQYTVKPTGWGDHVAMQTKYSPERYIKKQVFDQIQNLSNEVLLYNWFVRFQLANTEKGSLGRIDKSIVANALYDYLMSQANNSSFSPRKKLSYDQFSYSAKYIAVKDAAKVALDLESSLALLAIFESSAKMIETQELKSKLLDAFGDLLSQNFLLSSQFLWMDMGLEPNITNLLRKNFSDVFWDSVEKTYQRPLLVEYDLNNVFETNGIVPVVRFDNLVEHPMTTGYAHLYQKYPYLSEEEYAKILKPSYGFKVREKYSYIVSGTTYYDKGEVFEDLYIDEALTPDNVEMQGKSRIKSSPRSFSPKLSDRYEIWQKKVVADKNNVFKWIRENQVTAGGSLTVKSGYSFTLGWGAGLTLSSAATVGSTILGFGASVSLGAAGPIGVAISALISFFDGIIQAAKKWKEVKQKKEEYNRLVDTLGESDGLRNILNNINDFFNYAQKNKIEIDPLLKTQLEANQKYLRSMLEHGEDYWIDIQINELVKTWIWWIPPLPWPWPWIFGKMTRGAWYLAVPSTYKNFPGLDLGVVPPPTSDAMSSPLAPEYTKQWDEFSSWVSEQYFVTNTEQVETLGIIIEEGVQKMVDTYGMTKFTNIVTEITNDKGSMKTNILTNINVISDNEKDRLFETYVNLELHDALINVFGNIEITPFNYPVVMEESK